MREENLKRVIIKGIIAGAVTVTVDDICTNIIRPPFYIDDKVYRRSANRFANTLNHIAGLSIGYVIGKRVADEVYTGYDNAVKAYNGEEIIDG